jgi:hypothetical protein
LRVDPDIRLHLLVPPLQLERLLLLQSVVHLLLQLVSVLVLGLFLLVEFFFRNRVEQV